MTVSIAQWPLVLWRECRQRGADEVEVEANLISVGEKSERDDVSDSCSDTSSSDSDPSSDSDYGVKENDASKKTPVERRVFDEDDEDDDEGGAIAATIALRTKNELPEPDIMIPSIAQVGPDEELEKGEIMNIVNDVVVVKGEASSTHRISQHALDSETLLVYEDRKVLGYIHETYGPTYQPTYQVKFNSAHPLDLNDSETRVLRPVFHVPALSKYVFVAAFTKLRGSDAGDVHDEEPPEYELEFSDDEAEAAHKARLQEERFAPDLALVARSRGGGWGVGRLWDELDCGVSRRRIVAATV